jgi:hypothetical protein
MATDRGIWIARIWSDEDMVELTVEVSDGTSRFATRMYVGYQRLTDTIMNLDAFKIRVYGGLLDVRFGEFGPEYGGGAFHARLHFAMPRGFLITCHLESDFEDFGKQRVASRATLYLRSEHALLDRFIEELRRIPDDTRGEAWLEAV